MRTSTEAIVLRRTNYGEGDRIVTFLAPELGVAGALARGVRKPSSKLAGGIEPFSLVNVTLQKGKGELYTLVSSQMLRNFGDITKDYDRLNFGYQVLKKINRAAETLHETELYDLLKLTLESLDNAKIALTITESWFHLHFLQILGHGLNTSRDMDGKQLSEDNRYNFSISDMSFQVHPSGTFASDHLKVLKILQLKTPAFAANIRGVESVIDDCVGLLRNLDE